MSVDNRNIDKLVSTLDDINKSIKKLNDTLKKVFNNTDKSSIMYKFIDKIESIQDELKSSKDDIVKSIDKISDAIKNK